MTTQPSDIHTLEQCLRDAGTLAYRVRGVSMLPLLRQNRDLAVIDAKAPGCRCAKGDVILFKRSDGALVLHRVIQVNPGGYVTRGDNCARADAPISESQVLGIMTRFNRGGASHAVNEPAYQAYSKAIVAGHPLVATKLRARGVASAALRKAGLRK